MPFDIFEIAVNIVEPVLLFMLLSRKLAVIKRRLPYAVAGIIVLVAAEMFLSRFKSKLIFNAARKALAQKEGKA